MLALVQPNKYRLEMELFHDLFDFQTVGIPFEDSETGRTMFAFNDVEAAVKARKIKLIPCNDKLISKDLDDVTKRLKKCSKKFVKERVQAVYLGTCALSPKQKYQALEPLIAADIPVFTQCGAGDVRAGALISFNNQSAEEGVVVANIFSKIARGFPMNKLSQRFDAPVKLVINLRTAASIGWNPSVETLLLVDEFY